MVDNNYNRFDDVIVKNVVFYQCNGTVPYDDQRHGLLNLQTKKKKKISENRLTKKCFLDYEIRGFDWKKSVKNEQIF